MNVINVSSVMSVGNKSKLSTGRGLSRWSFRLFNAVENHHFAIEIVYLYFELFTCFNIFTVT
jgi:hypothetical protein